VVADLIRALLAALAAGVAPGYFWAAVLRPASGLAERLTYSAALSMASVPAIAVSLARASGAGVTLWVALVAVGIVFVTGVLAFLVKGVARGDGGPLLSSPGVVRDPRVLLLIAGLFVLALATMLHLPAPGWLLLVIAAGLILAGVLAARSAPVTGPAGNSPASGTASAAAPGAHRPAAPGPRPGRAARAGRRVPHRLPREPWSHPPGPPCPQSRVACPDPHPRPGPPGLACVTLPSPSCSHSPPTAPTPAWSATTGRSCAAVTSSRTR
jgi:hypothetical protein